MRDAALYFAMYYFFNINPSEEPFSQPRSGFLEAVSEDGGVLRENA